MPETVLVVGATGNVGVSAVIGALRSKRNVLAVVRNEAAAERLFRHAGTRDGIITVTANVLSENAVKGVVDKVKSGELPAFQHVYSAVGGANPGTPLVDISAAELREELEINFVANFFAYRDTIPYLLSQSNPTTFTLVTGAMGDVGLMPGPGITQGALFSLAAAAALDNGSTNVRFNEVYLGFPTQVDEEAAKSGTTKASDFARVYENILAKDEVRGSRVLALGPQDIETLRWESKAWKYAPQS